MKELEKIIGYRFKNSEILKTALAHSSYANEYRCQSYERLEFLGDSVLSIIISEYLYGEMKSISEGELSRIRASLVCEESLASLAKELGFGEFVLLGNGEEKAGSRNRNSILCDIFEAILAAIYLDGGMENAKDYVMRVMAEKLKSDLYNKSIKDYKSRLQEKVQRVCHDKSKIIYTITKESGPEHMKNFYVDLIINGKKVSSGIGMSKKEAEQKAAQAALMDMNYETL